MTQAEVIGYLVIGSGLLVNFLMSYRLLTNQNKIQERKVSFSDSAQNMQQCTLIHKALDQRLESIEKTLSDNDTKSETRTTGVHERMDQILKGLSRLEGAFYGKDKPLQ